MAEILFFQEPLNKEAFEGVVGILRKGGVILYPTDTVYGLGCDITSRRGVGDIFSLKRRDLRSPLSIAVADMEMMEEYVVLDEEPKTHIREKVPGQYTFILPKKDGVPDFVTSGLPTVGVRIPDYPPLLSLLEKFGNPIITTSANPSGEKAPASLEEVMGEIKENVDVVLDGGPCRIGRPSIIIDLTGRGKKVLRN